MRCEYCGATCTHCTLQYGCSDCHGSGGRQHSTAEAYAEHVITDPSSGTKTAAFPFSYHSKTAHGGPSSAFRTCVDCKQLDARCDVCENHSKRPAQARRRFPPALTAGQHFCDRCPSYVQSEADQTANGGWCRLQDSNVPNCLQADPAAPASCVFCVQDFYAAAGKCQACRGDLKRSAGCLRCSKDLCLECAPGYALANGRC